MEELKNPILAIFSVIAYMMTRLVYKVILKYKTQMIIKKLVKVDNYRDWQELASMLDYLQGLEKWKQETATDVYDWEKIEMRY